ncbi:MAG: sarcosine oxidase subunit gamma [Rhodobacteraceae bacterium]|nr:sarcosine oxidase subunit gamma [Paracoccaceae bacterium]MCC5965475.1 sarcosine oxidase subunit gamma [Natronohydrobacter sp.]
MIRLKETSAIAQLRLPTLADCTLRVLPPVRITSIAPYPGQVEALRARLGGFPAPGGVVTLQGTDLVWAGRDLAFAFGDDLPDGLAAHCSMSDQSDGWCGFALQGAGAQALLARRLPFDLRKMASPGSARSVMDHLPVLVLRRASDRFEIWVWRSMVQSALAHI